MTFDMFGWFKKHFLPEASTPSTVFDEHGDDVEARMGAADPFASLRGQVAVITGSTSGIGWAMAEALSCRGVKVVLNGLGDPAEIEANRRSLEVRTGAPVRYHGADMTDPAQIAAMVAFAREEFGRLDILVNNAGVQHVEAIETFPPEQWDRIIAVNLTSVFHAIRAAVPVMKAQKRGRIVNIASAHGLVASPFKSAYVAAKHGVLGLTKTVGLEVATSGVTCNAICPGYVLTPLVKNQIADQARARGMSEDDVVKTVILAAQPTRQFVTFDQLTGLLLYLVSDAGASANGSSFSIDGGWTAQ
jgi:3-hydroxybutyrate dehydrogenase